jgi:hypothetical protein
LRATPTHPKASPNWPPLGRHGATPFATMTLFRVVFGLLLLGCIACLITGTLKRDARWHRRGVMLLKWTLIAALGFFGMLAVERLLP